MFSRLARSVVWLSLVGTMAAPAAAQQPRPDNTGVNKQKQPTADQQSNDKDDIAITQKIRQAITDDKTLSTYAHNIKIVTQHGRVTLRGPVQTTDDRKKIEAKAVEVAGAGRVKNEISIAGASTKSTPKSKA
jgi:osmotically-inducible protein OsmY